MRTLLATALLACAALAAPLDAVPMGVAPGPSDDMILDVQGTTSASGFGHPSCKGGTPPDEIVKKLSRAKAPGPQR